MLHSRCPEVVVGSSGVSSETPGSLDSIASSLNGGRVPSRSSSSALNSKFSIESLVGASGELLSKCHSESQHQRGRFLPDGAGGNKTVAVDRATSGFSTPTAKSSSGLNSATAFVRVPFGNDALPTPPTGYFPTSLWHLTSAAAAAASITAAAAAAADCSYVPLQKGFAPLQLPTHLHRGLNKHHPYLPDSNRLCFWPPNWLDIFKDVYSLPQQYGADFSGLTNLLLPPFRKPKRNRTAFSPFQLVELERAFELNHYVIGGERKDLACRLQLSETQVKVWFQNRRTKHKRVKVDKSSTPTQSTPSSDYPSENVNGVSSSAVAENAKDESMEDKHDNE